MNFGLSAAEWDLLNELAVKPLKARNATVWIFGSRSRGDHRQFSDIDLLYESKDKLPPAFTYEIKSALEDSNLPYKVDLVDVDDLADSYLAAIKLDRIRLA